jgi:hypothetical protein
LRAYAIEQTRAHDTDEQQAAARRRFLDHYLHTAHAATLLLRPARDPIIPPAAAPGVTSQPLADRDAALAWFEAEHFVLLAATTRRPAGFDGHTWQLAWALLSYLSTRDSVLEVANTLLDLGYFAACQGAIHEALTHAETAYRAYHSVGATGGQAYAANNIGWYHGQLGNHASGIPYCEEALDILLDIDEIDGAQGHVTASAPCISASATLRKANTVINKPSPCAAGSATGSPKPPHTATSSALTPRPVTTKPPTRPEHKPWPSSTISNPMPQPSAGTAATPNESSKTLSLHPHRRCQVRLAVTSAVLRRMQDSLPSGSASTTHPVPLGFRRSATVVAPNSMSRESSSSREPSSGRRSK